MSVAQLVVSAVTEGCQIWKEKWQKILTLNKLKFHVLYSHNIKFQKVSSTATWTVDSASAARFIRDKFYILKMYPFKHYIIVIWYRRTCFTEVAYSSICFQRALISEISSICLHLRMSLWEIVLVIIKSIHKHYSTGSSDIVWTQRYILINKFIQADLYKCNCSKVSNHRNECWSWSIIDRCEHGSRTIKNHKQWK